MRSYDGRGRLLLHPAGRRERRTRPASSPAASPSSAADLLSRLAPLAPRTNVSDPPPPESEPMTKPACRVPPRPLHPVRREPDPAPAGRRLGVLQRLQPGRDREGRQGRAALPRARRRHHQATWVWPTSDDGIHFDRHPEPVLSPSEPYEEFGCEDPRVTEVDGTYYLTYSAWDRTHAQLCLATSKDLFTWEKHGPLFPDFNTFEPKARRHPHAVEQGRRHPRPPRSTGSTSCTSARARSTTRGPRT